MLFHLFLTFAVPLSLCVPAQVQSMNERVSDWCEALKLAMPAGEVENVERLSVGDAAQVSACVLCVCLCAPYNSVAGKERIG